MSAPNWLHNAHSYQNGENGAYNGAGDPSMAFMQTPTSSTFDFNQMQSHQLQLQLQLQQRMQNGNIANGSPVPQHPMYPTQPTIPSKRPRPRGDSMGGSPSPYPGALPASRSQTPHGSFPAYSGAVKGGALPGTNPYQTIQQAVTTPSLSPTMQVQPHNPHNPQHRVQTISPSPFSPAAHNFGNHTSPPQSESGSRVNTPHNNGQHYPHIAQYGMSPGQPLMPPSGNGMNGMKAQQYGQYAQQDQTSMETRVRQMGHLGAVRGTGHPLPIQPPNQMSNVQMVQLRAQQAQQSQQRPQHMQQMLQNIMHFTRQRGIAFNPQPLIVGRPVYSVQLFFGVLKMGGSRRISAAEQWPHVATLLGYPPPQSTAAGQELQNYWQSSLGEFEDYYLQHQQQQQQQRQQHQQQQQRQRAIADPTRAFQPGFAASGQPPSSPTKQMHDLPQTRMMQPPENSNVLSQTPTTLTPSAQPISRHPLPNGYIDPQNSQPQGPQPITYSQPASLMPTKLWNKSSQSHQASMAGSPALSGGGSLGGGDSTHPSYWVSRKKDLNPMYITQANNLELDPRLPHEKNEDSFPDTDQLPFAMNSTTESTCATNHGGLPITESGLEDGVSSLLKFKLRVPLLEELGPIDVRTIILSLRSGIHGEVRHALDTVASLSITMAQPSLDQCDDLVEALVDCAEDQVELLAEHAPEVSDAMLINSYEDTMRGCKVEMGEIQDFPEFGTLDHELNTAVDRLICITTILRNFTFSQTSQGALTDTIVLKMMTTVIRYLGTRNMMLRTHQNSLDFAKDVVVFLSQTAHNLVFSCKDEALCILHFLVSFGPLPEPNNGDDQEISFSSYSPSLNRYLPLAVDAMAKLLTREPNRIIYRGIFLSDATSILPYNLLTRAFGLAISPVPKIEVTDPISTATHRIPFMVQGLLAAELLISMIPNSEHHLAFSWVNSQDGFASRLMKMIILLSGKLSAQQNPQQQWPGAPHTASPNGTPDYYGYTTVIDRGLAVLRTLAAKARDPVGEVKGLPTGILPNKQSLIAALSTKSMHSDVVRQLYALPCLDA